MDTKDDIIKLLGLQNKFILECAGEGIFGLDLNGNHTFVNPAAAKMLGYEPDELIGKHSHLTWHHTKKDGSPYSEAECPIYAAYTDGHIHQRDDEVFWRKDGTNFPVEYSSIPIFDGDKLKGAVVTFTDITVRKQAEKKINDEIEHRKKIQAELIVNQERLRNLYMTQQSMREKERTDIAREIHDELGQIMTAIKMDIAWMKVKYADHEGIFEKTSSILNLVDATIKSVDRICAKLRPDILDRGNKG